MIARLALFTATLEQARYLDLVLEKHLSEDQLIAQLRSVGA